MFYIRADANKEIATGHIMRCLSIAEELRKRNGNTTFITADHQADEIIHGRGYPTICLNSQWNNLDPEIPKMKALIEKQNIKILLLDTYFVTENYLKELRRDIKIIYMDDLGKITYPADKIINYSIYGKEIDYCGLTGCCTSDLILGPQYAPLREEFQHIVPVLRKKVKGVFISTGGADKYNIAGALLEKIADDEKYADIEFHVISGKMNENLPKLLELEKNGTNIMVHSDVRRMSDIMKQCDIAISGCGSTMYELCSCGLPILTFSFADNQKLGAAAFEKEKAAINCGDARDGLELLADRILLAMGSLMKDFELRKSMHESASRLVDGQGVRRLADEILM